VRPRQPTDPLLGVIPGDPALRRVALGAWAFVALLGGGVLWYVTRTLRGAQALAVYDPRGAFLEVQRVVIPAVAVGVIAGVALSAYCLIGAVRIFRSGRFPAPGARVLRPTPVRRGAAAHRAGVAMMAISVVMLLVSLGLPVFLRRVMHAVQQTDHRFPAVPPDSVVTPDTSRPVAREAGVNKP
jgi:hypothetical protein